MSFGRLLNIFHTERSWHAYWFSLVSMTLLSDARAFSFLAPLEMSSSSLRLIKGFRLFYFSKCLLDLNNYKRFSLCPWKWRFPAMFCHAGPSSLVFFVACVASISVRFQSKERGTTHFPRDQNGKSRSSVFLCSETKQKLLLRKIWFLKDVKFSRVVICRSKFQISSDWAFRTCDSVKFAL